MTDSSRTTILYVHSSDELYGADLILLQLVEHLDPKAFRPIVVLPTDLPFDGRLSTRLRSRGVLVLHTKLAVLRRRYFHPLRFMRYAWYFIYSLVWLLVIIRREKVDVVHSNTLAIIPGAIAAVLTRKPHVWHIHEIITQPLVLWRLTAQLAGWLSTVNVAVSGATRDHLVAGNSINETKTIVIHNGIDTQRFSTGHAMRAQVRGEWNVQSNEVLVGMIGRFSQWKGQDYFLDVSKAVTEIYPSTRFAFVGGTVPGQNEIIVKFKKKIEKLGLGNSVIYSDYRTDIPAVLDAYDIFVLPSTLPDPFPTVVLEAMAMAKPIVANAHGGCIEMIDDQRTGFLVKPGAVYDMATAILYLISHQEQSELMGIAARERLNKLFSVKAFISRWIALYEDLARHGHLRSQK